MFMPSIFGESLLDDLFDFNQNHQIENKLSFNSNIIVWFFFFFWFNFWNR